MVILHGIFYLLVSFVTGLLLMGISLKVTARVQKRIGPPIMQPWFDILKLFSKKTNISHGYMMDISVIMLLGGTLLSLFFLPNPYFSNTIYAADIIVLLYLILFPSLGMAMGVGEAANPNGSIGISRALTMLVGYDFTLTIVAVGLAIAANGITFFPAIVSSQAGGFIHWNLFHYPLFTIAGFIALLGMLGEKPFEVMVAPHEIATGPMTEFGGKYLGMLFVQHAFALFIEIAIFVNLFLGGGGVYSFIAKIIGVFILLNFVNIVFARFKTEEAIVFFWKYPVVLAMIQLIWVVLK